MSVSTFLYNFNVNYRFLLGKNMQAESVILSQPFSPPHSIFIVSKFDTPKPFPTPSPPLWPLTQKRGNSVSVGSIRRLQRVFHECQPCFVGVAPAVVSGDRNVFLSDAAGVDVSAESRAKGQVLT